MAVGVSSERELEMYVVYLDLLDLPDGCAPGSYVVRSWKFLGRQPVPGHAVVTRSLEEARATIPASFVRIERSTEDVSAIVEAWI